MIRKAIILCGGLGTRLYPITKSVPKEMMPVLNFPAIYYFIENLKKNKITEILIILGRNKTALEEFFDKNVEIENKSFFEKHFKGINIYFQRQINPFGTGYALLKAKHFAHSEPFILIFPDEFIFEESPTKTLINFYNKHKTSVLPLQRIDIKNSFKYGMVKTEINNNICQIKKIIEKPKPQNSPSDICYLGGGIFTSEIFEYIDEHKKHKNEEIYITDAINSYAKKSKIYGAFIKGTRVDIGTPIGLVKANILAGLENKNTKIELENFIKEISKNLRNYD